MSSNVISGYALDSDISSTARELYVLLAIADGIAPDPADPALSELLAFGLITPHPDSPTDGRYLVLNPVHAATRRQAELYRAARDAISAAEALPDTLRDLSISYRSTERPRVGAVEYLEGTQAINARVSEIIADATQELLTSQPHGPRPRARLDISRHRDLDAIRRGVSMRTLYRATARADETTAYWTAQMTAAGGHVRTLDGAFARSIVVDRRWAIIDDPASPPDELRAVFVEDVAVAGYVAGQFDRDWAAAMPWTGGKLRTSERAMSDLQISVCQLLAAGHDQRQIARELNVSHRTVTHQIAQIKEISGAGSIFQLAMWWERRGS
ncbi:LuxR C-terminal-related transcriptional regulator [Kitasatospora cathayae]|uniref:LuxR C-terminal-related transcriptional regulator n=1 Tax=Kitasatospora cathayae TaxID=3004092 RepID=A0ABY7QA76_9ACTN|nr:LuxR C-terminal-related transcriptional regulator [Kitasatospora sp. HUAS 3-15]WBP89558.1 LuxR C-terminal-related transcriptional regulator [Kitasatospora sp. HUAS 3-15]